MKKSVVALITILSFLVGISGGIVCGFIFAPIKKGFNLKFKFIFNECGNKNNYKIEKGQGPDKKSESSPAEKIFRLTDNAKKTQKKGKGKWIGQK